MARRRKEPGHQQRWYWDISHGISQSRHQNRRAEYFCYLSEIADSQCVRKFVSFRTGNNAPEMCWYIFLRDANILMSAWRYLSLHVPCGQKLGLSVVLWRRQLFFRRHRTHFLPSTCPIATGWVSYRDRCSLRDNDKTRQASKPRGRVLELSYCVEIWQAPRPQCCRVTTTI